MKLPQISIRELFWLVALAACLCGWWLSRTASMAEVLKSKNDALAAQQERDDAIKTRKEVLATWNKVFDGVLERQQMVVREAGEDVRVKLAAAERRLRRRDAEYDRDPMSVNPVWRDPQTRIHWQDLADWWEQVYPPTAHPSEGDAPEAESVSPKPQRKVGNYKRIAKPLLPGQYDDAWGVTTRERVAP